LSKLWHSAPPNACSRSLRVNLWRPLLEQEVALREATVGKVLEVRIYLYTDRQMTERKKKYTLKLAVKCNQNNYAKAGEIIVQA